MADLSWFCGSEEFWNSTLLSESSWPQLTDCFINTVLIWVPCAFLWLPLPFYLHGLAQKEDVTPLPVTYLNSTKTFFSAMLSMIAVVTLIQDCSMLTYGYTLPVALYVADVLRLITYYERRRGAITSSVQFTFWLILLMSDIIPLYTIIEKELYTSDLLMFVLVCVSFVMEAMMVVVFSFSEAPRSSRRGYNSLERVGVLTDLEEADLFYLNPRDASKALVPPFEREWAHEQERFRLKQLEKAKQDGYISLDKTSQDSYNYRGGSNNYYDSATETTSLMGNGTPSNFSPKGRKSDGGYGTEDRPGEEGKEPRRPSLLRVLSKLVGPWLVVGLIQKVVSDVFLILSPVLLGLLIDYVSGGDAADGWQGYVLAVLMFLVQMVKSILFNFSFWSSQVAGMQLKTTLIAAIYKKDVMNFFFYAWTTPLQVVMVVGVLYYYIGAAVFAGVVTLLLLVPLNSYIAGQQQKLNRKNLKFKDLRLRLTNEILSGMKVLKLYAWEPSFESKITEIRNDETKVLLQIAYLNILMFVCWNIAPFLVTLATFATFVESSPENHLDARRAFVTLALFNMLRVPLALLSTIISMSVQAIVSIQRINKFICCEDLDLDMDAVRVERGTFTWDRTSQPTLRNINVRVGVGRLIAVVGQVGSGKSSLISSFLGEMDKVSGQVTIKSSVAYVPQQAWIQNATLRDNILFGKPYNEKRYQQILRACALERDLEILSAGDMTEIGEKGINLSGGQKQRVSLARSVYSDNDIFFFDDPLSAVDSHVGKHIFNKVIGPKGLLKNKTRILVTHGVHWLPMVDEIIVMSDGAISETGSYDQLMSHNGPFAQFLKLYLQLSEDSDNEEEDPEISTMINKIREDVETATSDAATSGDELTRLGKVKWSVFGNYLEAAGTLPFSASVLFFLLFQAATITLIFNNVLYWVRIVVASRILHRRLLGCVLRTPMSFFDTTPIGRMVNRFSRDIETIDNNLPIIIRDFLSTGTMAIVTLIVISISTPLFLTLVVPILLLYHFIQGFYIPTSRQLKRIESVTRSPIYVHFSETISGGPTIRAYRASLRFIEESKSRVDRNQSFYFASLGANRWLGMNLEIIANIVIFGAAIFAVITPDIEGGTVGLSVSYAMQISSCLTWMVRQMSDLETNIVSVERVKEYSELEPEAPWINPHRRPIPSWPTHGRVMFSNYCTRYRPGLDLVLKGVNFTIEPGQKVGIVGRTGAGKSSLTLSLFRLIESAGGCIMIDGVNIADIGLHDLRSRITILPQDPVLFSGTLRMNLDPLDQYTDDQIWKALDRAHLKHFAEDLPERLYYQVGEEGQSLSVGQRQLLCLARTLLRRTKILVLDEATAAVDMETDTLIQNTIRTAFSTCTIITIAHRLNTIMDYDLIMVLDAGVVKEYDSPHVLLDDKKSIFYSMAKDADLV
ncbi:hypothetical protein BaRGS_00008966 [Batillaria attramentaria]|uniref:ABC-type glutathione-S-conjugate transporter n=1 Tax=Batillaria attramentaria TaxID=370345 RepID=A0ABD0LKE4_9CAEN